MQRKEIKPDVWTYSLADGFEVLAGKSNVDNDLLSLKVASANDLWFHLHAQAGSHVILRHPGGETPDNASIKVAAAIAAWHSKARNAGKVPVCYTQAKNVTKPRGANPGTVSIKHEKIVKVRPELPTD